MIIAYAVLPVATGEPDIFAPLLQYGALGLMLVTILVLSAGGVLYWKPSVDWLRQRIEQQQQINDTLLDSNQKAIPALGEAVSAMRAMSDALGDLRREIISTREELHRVREEIIQTRGH